MKITLAIVIDTFREALARWIFIGLFTLSTLMILFFLFVMKIDLVEGATATISLMGLNSRSIDASRLVQNVYGGIATFLYTWGMGLTVFASAGLIPRVMEPGRIELILSKPVSRTHILVGRYIGNIVVVAGNVCYLMVGVWTILGIKTGIWKPNFLYGILTTIFTFSVLLTVVTLVGVMVESTALATMVTTALMIVSPLLAQTGLAMRLLSSETSRAIWRGLYYALPKIYDMGTITLNAVRGQPIESWMPVWSSAMFGVVVMSASVAIFSRRNF